jgi:pimeloyl-ACP methyl ester carboxylesterase
MTGGMLIVATAVAAGARAWTWVELGLSGLLVVVALALLLVRSRSPRARRIALALAAVGLARVAWAAAPAAAVVSPDALVKTRFTGSPPGTRLFCQGVPESETMRLGAWVGLSPREYLLGGPAIDSVYAEIARSDLFERRESPLLDSWLFDREHFWLAVPRKTGPVPLIVFIHGNGGTFQFYPQLLARAAVERGFAIAFPSNGFGFWEGRDAALRVGRVVDAVAREVEVDRARIVLVGLSAGGPGVFAAALEEPGRYHAAVAVSAVFPDLERCAAMKTTKVLILHGTEDPRARIEDARAAHAALRRGGVDAELLEERGQDHLALVTARERWVPLVLDWIAGH